MLVWYGKSHPADAQDSIFSLAKWLESASECGHHLIRGIGHECSKLERCGIRNALLYRTLLAYYFRESKDG